MSRTSKLQREVFGTYCFGELNTPGLVHSVDYLRREYAELRRLVAGLIEYLNLEEEKLPTNYATFRKKQK